MNNYINERVYCDPEEEEFEYRYLEEEYPDPDDSLYCSQEDTGADEEFRGSELIISKDCRYSLDDRSTRLNNNVLVAGGSGTGKTSTIVIPNLLRAVGSYVVSDPKGNLYRKYGGYLKERGYNVLNIDFTHPERSDCYNPFRNIRTTQDIRGIVSTIIYEQDAVNTKDPYWENMASIMLSAIIGYMVETEYGEFNFSGALRLLREGERKDEDDKTSELSRRFDRLRHRDPDSWACGLFDDADSAPYRTYDTIRSTVSSKISRYDTAELRRMMDGKGIDLTAIGKVKTAVFVTVSDTDRSMDTLANIFFTQAMNRLCEFADSLPDSRLPVPVRFFLDDFATNCHIGEFPRMISSIRSRGISVMLMIQAEAQLAAGYGRDCSTIIANCDTYVYLGGNDYDTARSVSLRCDKPIRSILQMPMGSCWVFRRGSQSVFSETLVPGECEKEFYMPAAKAISGRENRPPR